ncbi:MAG: DUF2064 domain-containing protein [Pseudomonadota bacterium]
MRHRQARGTGTLVVMVKVPMIGRVKTRLARDIGGVRATSFYRAAARALLTRLSGDRRWRTVLAVAPDTALMTRAFAAGPKRMRQGDGDLGRRLNHAMRQPTPGAVVVIGTDIPAIRARDVAAALSAARRAGAVFGPAPDGGYWLVGLRQTPRAHDPFRGVRWSTEHALADTETNLARARGLVSRLGPSGGAVAARLRVLDDVDDGETYARVAAWSGRVVLPTGV